MAEETNVENVEQTENVQNENNVDQQESTEVKFETQSELDSFVDKRVSQALNTAKSKWEAEAEEEMKAREDKAKKLARMTEAERTKAEQEERENALTKRERELQKREYGMQAKSILAEAGLPNDDALVSLVLDDDVEKTSANIKYVNDVISTLVTKRVDELSKQSAPKSSSQFGGEKVKTAVELGKNSRIL